MLIAYQEKTDKKDNINRFSVGDRVLMKRIFGPHKKMSVRWKEDKNGLAYTVVTIIGPVNYATRENGKSRDCNGQHAAIIRPKYGHYT